MYTYRHTLSLQDASPIGMRFARSRAKGPRDSPSWPKVKISRCEPNQSAAMTRPASMCWKCERVGSWSAGSVEVKASGTKRSEEHTSELQSLMRISYAVFCLKKKTYNVRLSISLSL